MDYIKRICQASALPIVVCLVVCPLACWPRGLSAQPVPGLFPSSADGEQVPDNVFIRPDRGLLLQLSTAQALLKDQRYADAIESLDRILEGPEDYFFQPDKDNPAFRRSIKAEAHRLIGQMPSKGLETYQLKFGAEAANELAAAKRSGDVEALARVARRFFHTKAGTEAVFLLGVDHFDHSRPLAASLVFQRLRDGASSLEAFEPALSLLQASCHAELGAADKAWELLRNLKEKYGSKALTIGGRPVAWFDKPENSTGWLKQAIGARNAAAAIAAENWATFKGDAARNAVTAGGAPLMNPLWEIPPSSDNPALDEAIRRIRTDNAESGEVVLPGFHPLAIGDLVVMRTPKKLLAVDFSTGRRLWETADSAIDITVDNSPNRSVEQALQLLLQSQLPQANTSVWQRMSADATYGLISSDGARVFAVEDPPPADATTSKYGVAGAIQTQSVAALKTNRLTAYDVHTGKIVWNLGGPAGKNALPEADTFFLGAPLPLMGQLYVLAERGGRGEISLLALDARTGKVIWSQSLVMTEKDAIDEAIRRPAGISPSYSDGILVCPTSYGAVVAVDLASRSLLWGFNYRRAWQGNRDRGVRGLVMAAGITYSTTSPQQNHWADAIATIANGRVLIAPPDSDSLNCINLSDGKLLWSLEKQSPQREDLFLACATDDKAILVGRREIRAVSLTETTVETKEVEVLLNGGQRIRTTKTQITHDRPKPAWEGRAIPLSGAPSGRGFLSGETYYLPLATAEIAAVDLSSGRIEKVTKTRDESVLGNLVAYKGKILSQGFDGVRAFYQLDAAGAEADRRLAADASDAGALSLRAEILLDEGRRSEAVDFFRKAYQSAGEAPQKQVARSKLRDVLMDGLAADFAANRVSTAELETLLDDADQRGDFHRAMADGLRKSGEFLAAFRQYETLFDLEKTRDDLEESEPGLLVRRDRWMQGQLASLRSECKNRLELDAINKSLGERLAEAIKSKQIEPLRKYLDYFGREPAAAAELVRRLADSNRLLEAEMFLWPDWQSGDPKIAGPAAVALAEMLRKANRAGDAVICYRRLAKEFADVVCLGGKTGKQLVADLPAGDLINVAMADNRSWPVGVVEVDTRASSPAGNASTGRTVTGALTNPLVEVKIRNDPAPFYYESQVRVNPGQRVLEGSNGWGTDRWRVPLSDVDMLNATNSRTTSDALWIDEEIYYDGLPATVSDSSGLEGFIHGHLLLTRIGNRMQAIDLLGSSGKGGPRQLWSQDLSESSSSGGAADIESLISTIVLRGNAPRRVYSSSSRASNNNASAFGPVTSRYACFQQQRKLVAVDSLTGQTLWIRQNMPSGCYLFGDDEYVFALPADQKEALVFRAIDGRSLGKREIPRTAVASASVSSTSRVIVNGNIVINTNTNTNSTPQRYAPFQQTCIGKIGRKLVLWNKEGSRYVLDLFDPWENRHLWESKTLAFDSGSVAFMFGAEGVIISNAQGRFVLVSLPDGRTVVDANFNKNRNLSTTDYWYASTYLDTYIVAAGSSSSSALSDRTIQPLPGQNGSGIMRQGLVWAFDKNGKPLWNDPVQIQNQYLLSDQPTLLPVLAFACQEMVNETPTIRSYKTSILCVDKRNGRIAYPLKTGEGKLAGAAGAIDIVGDPQQHTVELRAPQQTICLKFTDKPLPPLPPSTVAPATGRGGVLEAMIKQLPGMPVPFILPPDFEPTPLPVVPPKQAAPQPVPPVPR
jgi:outer membrane protein assembly factor BamB